MSKPGWKNYSRIGINYLSTDNQEYIDYNWRKAHKLPIGKETPSLMKLKLKLG